MLTIEKLWFNGTRQPAKNVFTQGPSAQLSVWVLNLNFVVGYLQKRVFMHIGAQLRIVPGEPFPGTKCEHCLRVRRTIHPVTLSVQMDNASSIIKNYCAPSDIQTFEL